MDRKKRWVLLLAILILMVGCKVAADRVALNKTRSYIESIHNKDVATQLRLLEAFSPKRASLESFLSYVISAQERSLTVAHEDRQVIIVQARFQLRLKEDYPSDGGFHPGVNEVTRYFAYYKNRDMELREILSTLIK